MKQSAPFALMVLLMTLYNRLDPVMLGSLLPKPLNFTQAGVYASGYRLLDAANMIAFLFAVLLVPIFSRMLKRKESVEEMVKLSFTLIITVSVIVAFGSYFYSHELMASLYDTHIDQSAAVFRLLMGGFVAVSTSYIFGTLLTANGNLKVLNIISLSGLAINLCMNFWLIPRYMAVGSAYASLATQFFTAGAQLFMVQRIFRFRMNYRFLFTLVVFTIGVILFNYISQRISFPVSGLPLKVRWIPNFVISIVLSLILAVALRLLSLKSMFSILKTDRG